jgi:aminoglycoside phosphotransferase (APT) family kinase protein
LTQVVRTGEIALQIMSSDRPWEADRSLTRDTARLAIASQFPEVDARRLGHLGSGWEFDAYVTADGWVFRFPRRAEYAGVFDWESAVHRMVTPFLAPSVSVPNVELLGVPGTEFPYAFAGHRLLPGLRADDHDVQPAATLAGEIGAALSAIHSVPEAEARSIGVEPDLEGSAEWFQEALEAGPSLREMDSSIASALDWLGEVAATPAPYSGPLRFIHNDLCPDHVLVSRDSGGLTGIIDWTDAALGDPALDFAVFAAWRGWDFVGQLKGSYGLPLDSDFNRRLSFLARVLSLVWLAEAHEQGTDVGKHTQWVKNAFAGSAS